jgi:starvation-inducible DNA-binding protein
VSTSTSVSLTHLPPLGGQVREEVTLVLQQALVELIDLGLVGKQLHWTVVGGLFRPMREQLDEFVDSWRDLAGTVGERLSPLEAAQMARHPRLSRAAVGCQSSHDRSSLEGWSEPSRNVWLKPVSVLATE